MIAGMGEDKKSRDDMSTDIGKLDKATTQRLIDIGRRLPSLSWWYNVHPELGCSPRDAVDRLRLDEVEKLLPPQIELQGTFPVGETVSVVAPPKLLDMDDGQLMVLHLTEKEARVLEEMARHADNGIPYGFNPKTSLRLHQLGLADRMKNNSRKFWISRNGRKYLFLRKAK